MARRTWWAGKLRRSGSAHQAQLWGPLHKPAPCRPLSLPRRLASPNAATEQGSEPHLTRLAPAGPAAPAKAPAAATKAPEPAPLQAAKAEREKKPPLTQRQEGQSVQDLIKASLGDYDVRPC